MTKQFIVSLINTIQIATENVDNYTYDSRRSC